MQEILTQKYHKLFFNNKNHETNKITRESINMTIKTNQVAEAEPTSMEVFQINYHDEQTQDVKDDKEEEMQVLDMKAGELEEMVVDPWKVTNNFQILNVPQANTWSVGMEIIDNMRKVVYRVLEEKAESDLCL
jgi:Txe/YoeB family toxin of Txe-Axe toxin-antitoxin module